MSKQLKIIIAVAIVIVLVIVLVLFFKPGNKTTPETQIQDPSSANPVSYLPDNFPFNEGSAGENVRRLQIALNRIGGNKPKIAEDGIFGHNTKIKLLTTVDTTLSQLPMSEENLRKIIVKGNRA